MRKNDFKLLLLFLPLLTLQTIVVLDSVTESTKPNCLHMTSNPNLFLVSRYDDPNITECTVSPNAQTLTCNPVPLVTTK